MSVLPTEWSNALALTFLHALWQGVLVGALVGVALDALRSRSAASRYAVCVAGMITFSLAPVVTFLLMRQSGGAFSITPALTQPNSALAPLYPWLTTVWISGATLLQLRFIFAWIKSTLVTRRGVLPAAERWRRTTDDIARRLGIHQPVRLLESRLATVPSVVGAIRPVLLFPVGLLDRLPANQIRAIIAHELAHVRRYDFVVNAFQGVFESILFFHPVTWWLSNRLRVEREYCCDDVAVTVCASRLEYARALSALEELRHEPLAVALSAKGGSLVSRIQRMIGGSAEGRSPKGRTGASVMALLATTMFVWLVAVACETDDTSTSPVAAVEQSANVEATDVELAKVHLAELHDKLKAEVESGVITKDQMVEQFKRAHEELAKRLHANESLPHDAHHNVFFHEDGAATVDVRRQGDHTVVELGREGESERVVLEFLPDATPDQAHDVVLEKIRAGEISKKEAQAALEALLHSQEFDFPKPEGEPVFEFKSE